MLAFPFAAAREPAKLAERVLSGSPRFIYLIKALDNERDIFRLGVALRGSLCYTYSTIIIQVM